jgi:hypothetical protein
MKLLTTIAIFASLCIAQEPASKKPVQIGDIVLSRGPSMDHGPTLTMFTEVLASANVPGGVVYTSGCQPAPDIAFRAWQGQPLAQLLDSTIAQDPSYAWSFHSGAVNLFPKSGLPDIFRLTIKHFEWSTSTFGITSASLLFGQDSVRNNLANRGMVEEPGRVSASAAPKIGNGVAELAPPEIKSVDNLDVLSTLNAIAASRGNGVWSYEEHVCGSVRMFRLGFRER